VLVLPFNEGFIEEHIDFIGDGFHRALDSR
jgi:hypothetical protein